MRLQPPAPLENRARQVRGRFRRSSATTERRSAVALARDSQHNRGQTHGVPPPCWSVRTGSPVRLRSRASLPASASRKGLPHGRSRQSSEGPQRSAGPAKRVDGRDRPCVVNALRAQRGPYPVAPPTGLNPPTPLSGEPQFCPQILRPAFRLARKGLPHGRSRQSSEGPQRSAGPAKRVDGREPCVVNALRAQRGPYPVAPPTGPRKTPNSQVSVVCRREIRALSSAASGAVSKSSSRSWSLSATCALTAASTGDLSTSRRTSEYGR